MFFILCLNSDYGISAEQNACHVLKFGQQWRNEAVQMW